MGLEELAEISRYYGGNSEYVIAGGGNTSFKDEKFLYIKASGTSLGQAKPADFVKMDRAALSAIWGKKYPEDSDAREAAVLADMMASRCPGEDTKRPSVETLLHDLLPFVYVVHTHPALVNGLTCSQDGETAMRRLFPEALWIPLINPGYILSRVVKDALDAVQGKTGPAPKQVVIFLQNHGVFVAADTIAEIREIYKSIMETLGKNIGKTPDASGLAGSYGNSGTLEKTLVEAAKQAGPGSAWFVKFERNKLAVSFIAGKAAFGPVASAFTPDHIVYSGSDPLFVETEEPAEIEKAFKIHIEKTGRIPKIIAVQSLGIFGLGNSEKAVDNALELFRDTQKVAFYSQSFGGPRFMTAEMIGFINNWEVERYRSGVAVK